MFRKIQSEFLEEFSNLFNKSGLERLIVRGGVWLGAGGVTVHGLRLVRNMILTRLMAPDAFGLMAIVMSFNVFFESFTQIGVKESIIQNMKGNEDTYLNAAFWLAFIRGLFLYITAFILVPLLADFYSNPNLVPMMRVVFLSIFFNGVMSPKSYISLKQMDYKRWVIVVHGGGVIGIFTTIALGFVLQNVWALVIGFTVEAAVRCFLSYVICPFQPGFNFEKESLKSLFNFARGIFGLPILVFLYNQIDIFVIGKLCSSAELGMYSLARSFVQMPFLLFSSIISPLLLPTFSSMQHDQLLLKSGILKSSKYIAGFFLPVLTLMACFSSQLLAIAYGKIYSSVSLVFMIFCCILAIRILGTIIVTVFFALGQPQLTRQASIIRIGIMIVLIVPFVKKAGLYGAAFASLISMIIWISVTLIQMRKIIELSIANYFYSRRSSIVTSIFVGGIIVGGLILFV